jgi:hypothetical protein
MMSPERFFSVASTCLLALSIECAFAADATPAPSPPAPPPAPPASGDKLNDPAAAAPDATPAPAPNPPPPPQPAAEEEPRVDAEIYYSETDPRWEKDVKPLVDDVEKKFKIIRMNRVSIDTPEGVQKLAEAEKDHLITDRGEVTFIFGPYSLVSKGDKHEVELYMEPMIARLLNPDVAKGRLPANVADYAKEIFGKSATAEPSPSEKDQKIRINKVLVDGKAAGWVVDAYNPIKCPICGDVQFLMAVSPEFKALDVRPVRQLERRGRKLDEAEVTKFMGQFKRELPKTEPLKVDGISGATKTTMAYEQAMNEVIKTLVKSAEK